MIRALYTAASSLVSQSIKQDVTANNIANAQTPGFKRARIVSSSFAQVLENSSSKLPNTEAPNYPQASVSTSRVSSEQAQDYSQGNIMQTSNKMDFAIEGPGAFRTQTDRGIELTRAGSFQLNSKEELCTTDGALVLGEKGKIVIPKGDFEVQPDGSIVSKGQTIDKLSIAGADSSKTQIKQGCLENSNVNIIKEMVSMISNLRSFEANQKIIQSVDETLGKLMEVGKV